MVIKSAVLDNIFQTCKKELHALFWFCFGINVLLLAMPLYSMQLFDRVLSSRSVETLIMLTLLVIICIAVQMALTNVRQILMQRLGEKVEIQLSEKVLKASVRSVIVYQRGRNAQAVRDVGSITNFFAGMELMTILDMPWAPLYLVIIFLFDSALGMVALSGVVIILILAIVTELIAGGSIKRAGTAGLRNIAFVDVIVRQAEAVYSMGMIGPLTRRMQAGARDNQRIMAAASDRVAVMTNITRFVRMALQVAIMVTAAIQVLNATITPGAMIVSNILLAKTLAPAEGAIGTWKALASLRAAVERVDGMMQLWFDYSKNLDLPAPTGRLAVDRLTYSVPTTPRPLLRGVSFKLEPGEMLGIVGPSGAGKSTLARALVNALKPSQGTIRLDGADMVSWEPDQLGRYIGYLPQSVELFPGTIGENIARFTDASSEKIIEAAKMAGVHDLILQFRRGYDTMLGDDEGVQLSGGQRQRIGLARALFDSPKLIVLDEPNANLDAEGEKALVSALVNIKAAGATVIIIAHRPAVMAHVDKILLLRDGIAEAFGAAQELGPKLGLGIKPRVVAGAIPNKGDGAVA